MQEARVNYLWVGSFVLVAGALLVVALALLVGRTGATDPYHTYFDRVAGVSTGTRVLYNGFPVGQVEGLAPVEHEGRQRFRVELSVRRGWPVAPDSEVHVVSGLLSAVELDIRGRSPRDPLEPGEYIPGRDTGDVFASLSSAADELTQLVEQRVGPLLEDLAQRVPTIGANLEAVSQDLAETTARVNAIFDDEGAARIDSLLRNAELTSQSFAQLSLDLRATRGRLDDVLRSVAETVDRNSEHVDQSLVDLRYSLESVARHIDGFNENLEATTRNMNEFSRQVRANPGLLLGGRPPPVAAEGER